MSDQNRIPSTNTPEGAQLVQILQKQLRKYMGSEYTDVSLAEYIAVLLAHHSDKTQVIENLQEFLGEEDSVEMTAWIFDNLPRILRDIKPSSRDNSRDHHRENQDRAHDHRHHHRSRSRSRSRARRSDRWDGDRTEGSRYRDQQKQRYNPDDDSYYRQDDRREKYYRHLDEDRRYPSSSNRYYQNNQRQQQHGATTTGNTNNRYGSSSGSIPVSEVIASIDQPPEYSTLEPARNITVTVPNYPLAPITRRYDQGGEYHHHQRSTGRDFYQRPRNNFSRDHYHRGMSGNNNRQTQQEMAAKIDNLKTELTQLKSGRRQPSYGTKPPPRGGGSYYSTSTVLVEGVTPAVTDAILHAHFSVCGTVTRVTCLRHPLTGHRSLLAYIDFMLPNEAQNALALHGSPLLQHTIHVYLKGSKEAAAAVAKLNRSAGPPLLSPAAAMAVLPSPMMVGPRNTYTRRPSSGSGEDASAVKRNFKYVREQNPATEAKQQAGVSQKEVGPSDGDKMEDS